MFDFSGTIQKLFSFAANDPLVPAIIVGSMYIFGLMLIGIMFTGRRKTASMLDTDK
ncbi:hypothetical protein GJC41_18470 [Salmonella enterica]|nr:hypothetical protein [Salmonella enterica]EIJ4064717.1 hypothetical protein [Salmonella enterica]